ncbi:MAG: phosphoribosylamine--glycine ligase [Bdellovibrio sp.]
MRLVVVGKGGREHALAKKLKESSLAKELWVCPGNPGMTLSGLTCVNIETPESIEKFCLDNKVSLVVVGPEAVILSDLKRRLTNHNIHCFAPSQEVAKLESSKLFCKKVLIEAGVPTANFELCNNREIALQAVSKHNFSEPLVVKADGLAQGKGVWVCESHAKATEAVETLSAQFGFPLLLEECLVGKELSAFALCDGKDFVILGTACDYKRITPDPFSANTGGMGAYSPCDFITSEDENAIRNIFSKTLNYLLEKNLPYQGFLFAGLMKTEKGISVIEYNVRMGDPETQALMPRIESDFAKLIMSAVTHELKGQTCKLSSRSSVHIVAVSKGYPQSQMLVGQSISLPALPELNSTLYFAGVSGTPQHLTNSGGRVLGVTAMAENKASARKIAYEDIKKISYQGMYYREDIGQ